MQLFGNNASTDRRATIGIIPHPGFRVEPAVAGRRWRMGAARWPWIGAAETPCPLATPRAPCGIKMPISDVDQLIKNPPVNSIIMNSVATGHTALPANPHFQHVP